MDFAILVGVRDSFKGLARRRMHITQRLILLYGYPASIIFEGPDTPWVVLFDSRFDGIGTRCESSLEGTPRIPGYRWWNHPPGSYLVGRSVPLRLGNEMAPVGGCGATDRRADRGNPPTCGLFG